MKTRKNESNPSRMVRETACALCVGFFGLAYIAANVALFVCVGPLATLAFSTLASAVIAAVNFAEDE